jgi:hypothetical protein
MSSISLSRDVGHNKGPFRGDRLIRKCNEQELLSVGHLVERKAFHKQPIDVHFSRDRCVGNYRPMTKRSERRRILFSESIYMVTPWLS